MAGVNERERENDKSTDRVAGNVFESWCNGVDLFWETEENTHRHQWSRTLGGWAADTLQSLHALNIPERARMLWPDLYADGVDGYLRLRGRCRSLLRLGKGGGNPGIGSWTGRAEESGRTNSSAAGEHGELWSLSAPLNLGSVRGGDDTTETHEPWSVMNGDETQMYTDMSFFCLFIVSLCVRI